MTTTDFVPQSYKNLHLWLTKQNTDLTTALAATVGMTTAERTAYLAAVGVLLPAAAEIVDLMEQLEQKTADFAPLLAAHLPIIRAGIKRAKTSPGCTPGIAVDMEWVGESHEFNPATARPNIKVTSQPGRVKVEGNKPGFDSANIYSRLAGEVPWKQVAVRKRKFPFFDEAPLAVAGVPERREYMAMGVIDDEEVGQPSEIREVLHGG